MRNFTAVVEKCLDGILCWLRARIPRERTHKPETLDELNENLREVIEMLLEEGEPRKI